jgi:glycosyltransferase involved in cell wall biosynthesis
VRPRIAVLISTYNGEAFLAAQLDSLLAQEGVAVEVFARDDGSSDATLAILADYAHHWPALARPLTGPNLGPAASFLTLLASAPDSFDGYAFCDQDDVWLPDKLARAMSSLGAAGEDAPALYCSRVMCVDAALRPLGPAPIKHDSRFEHLLFENIAFGVTVVMNRPAAALVRAHPPGAGMIMHDWWCALTISAFGSVTYDPQPGVLYRQHGRNQIGQSPGRIGEWARLAKLFARAPRRFWPIHAQAAEFLRLYGPNLDPGRRRRVEAVVDSRRSLAARLAFAASGDIRRADALGALIARVLVAANLY